MSPTKNPEKSTATKKPPKIKQACDCCHARKIRCDGAAPCNNCQTTSLPCTYLLIPKKKGPKGPSSRTPRAVLKMRMHQEQERTSNNTAATAQVTNDGLSNSTSSPPLLSPSLENGMSGTSFTQRFEPSPLFSLEVAQKCVDTFYKHKYPITPILDRERFCASLKDFRYSPESYGLVAAMSAAMISLHSSDSAVSSPADSYSGLSESPVSVDFFIREAERSKRYRDVERPLLSDAQTNFFLFAALFNLDRHNSAWFHLREAMTMVQMMRLHEEATYLTIEDDLEALYSRRTFWLLFITERAYALQRHRPLTLQRTISLPTITASDPDAAIISGFLDLVALFQNFDDNFVRIWNFSSQTTSNPPYAVEEKQVSAGQLEALQMILAKSLPDIQKRTETQQADLLISRQWLKTMVWQLCVAKGLLSSSSKDDAMSFHYPVTIARDVAAVSTFLKKEAFEAHGVGILEKIFDIGCSLSDVLQLQQSAPRLSVVSMEVGPRDYLLEMLRLLSTVLGGSSRYLPLLAAKADQCLQVGPRGMSKASDDPEVRENGGLDIPSSDGTASPKALQLGGHDDHPSSGLVSNGVDGVNGMHIGEREEEFKEFVTLSEPPVYAHGLWVGTEVHGYDFGSLSEASTAWLGSLPDEYVDDSLGGGGGDGGVGGGGGGLGPLGDVDEGEAFDPIAAFTT